MPMLADLPDLPLPEAVAAARALAPHEPRAWEALDRVFRGQLVGWLQERRGDPDTLGSAFFAAARDAGGIWQDRWFYLMELLRDGADQPASATSLQVLHAEQWAGRILGLVAAGASSRKVLKDQIHQAFHEELSESHLSNVLAKLEEAGLLRRSRLGRETGLILLPAGQRLARLLTPSGAARPAANRLPPGPPAVSPFWRNPGPIPQIV